MSFSLLNLLYCSACLHAWQARLTTSPAMVLNGAIGAKIHVPFSVAIRSSFGYYFAYFCIVSRAILAMFWLGIQGANGAICITVMSRYFLSNFTLYPDFLETSMAYICLSIALLFWTCQIAPWSSALYRPCWLQDSLQSTLSGLHTIGFPTICLHLRASRHRGCVAIFSSGSSNSLCYSSHQRGFVICSW